MNNVNKALQLAREAHYGQVDKRGEPYIYHPIRVALLLDKPFDRIVGLLHDVAEDTKYTLDDIESEFGIEIAHVVEKLTHDTTIPYMDYIEILSRNKSARAVKIADLKDNLDPAREYKNRNTTKYKEALTYLLNK